MIAAIRRFIKYANKPKNVGYCLICEGQTVFIETADWLRDNYICVRCNSIPRHRALIKIVHEKFPSFLSMKIHESSPSGAASAKLKKKCLDYTPTYFYPDLEPGKYRNGFRSENLEKMTFADNSFDLMITQDVMEHVMNPAPAFAEIARIIKPGGAHVFTVPVFKGKKTLVRAYEKNGQVYYPEEKDFHGNPIDREKGSLVTREWGDDLIDFIKKSCGLKTEVYSFDDRKFGLVAEFLDVYVCQKPISSSKH
ncbi:MAG: class I SAM-dependent methyltransferase [Desulfuromusa sp.]|nr:class I SAM-dependent methyltransferase [Desulfuromusa sp.]